MTLGEQIKQAREQKNLSQEDLAAQLGVSRQAVSKWENDSSLPQGINREMLSKILEINLVQKEELKSNKGISMAGWIVSIILLLFLSLTLLILFTQNSAEKGNLQDSIASTESQEIKPAFSSIRFYDHNMNEVLEEALWYDASKIECILVSWEGESPDSIKIFANPSGTETLEKTELLLIREILDGDNVALLSAEVLKSIVQEHIVFVLDYGESMVSSEVYNVFNYSEEENEIVMIHTMMDQFCAEQGLENNTNYFAEETWTYASGQPKLEEMSTHEVIFTFWKEENGYESIRSIYFDTYDTGTMEPRD